jgi:hypothetical protein
MSPVMIFVYTVMCIRFARRFPEKEIKTNPQDTKTLDYAADSDMDTLPNPA